MPGMEITETRTEPSALVIDAMREGLAAANLSGREVSRRAADRLDGRYTDGTIQTLLSRTTTTGRGLTGPILVAVLDVLKDAHEQSGADANYPTLIQAAANVMDAQRRLEAASEKASRDRQVADRIGALFADLHGTVDEMKASRDVLLEHGEAMLETGAGLLKGWADRADEAEAARAAAQREVETATRNLERVRVVVAKASGKSPEGRRVTDV